MGIGRISFAAAQRAYDNMSPPEDDDKMIECSECQGDLVTLDAWRLATDIAEEWAGSPATDNPSSLKDEQRVTFIDKARRRIIDVLLQHNAAEYGCDHCGAEGEIEWEDTGPAMGY